MKTRNLISMVSLAVLVALVSLGGRMPSTTVAPLQLRADGGEPPPPPLPWVRTPIFVADGGEPPPPPLPPKPSTAALVA